MNKSELINALDRLSGEPGFLYTLAIAMRRDFFLAPEEAADINWKERLSFQEASFLVGLMIKHKLAPTELPTEAIFHQQIERLYQLFHELHRAHNQPFLDALLKKVGSQRSEESENVSSNPTREEFQNFFSRGELMTEPIFYGGSGAYDFQYCELAPQKYGDDEEWITKNKGLSVASMAAIAEALKKVLSKKALNLPRAKTFEEFCRGRLAHFTFTRSDLGEIDSETFEKFIQTFSVSPGNQNPAIDSVGSYNIVDSHPIIVLAADHYFLPVAFNLAQSIYESPFYWMSRDSEYASIAFNNRGNAAEKIAHQMLVGVFGVKSVFKNVKILKNKKELLTDIDVLAICGNKAVIVQAKAKKLTALARKGNDDQLKKDFVEAIQNAYEQGLICREALIGQSNSLLSENGNELHLSEQIDDAYIICLTTDHYPAVTYQAGVYLEQKAGNPSPLAMSVFDLDIVAYYLKDPFEFLYYLRQRVNLAFYFKASSEIALLAYHLRVKLFRSPKVELEVIAEEFSQLIDANFPAMRGHQPKSKAIQKLHTKWKNEKFDELVKCVKDANVPSFTDAIFSLYDLAGDAADRLILMMEKAKRKSSHDGKSHDFSVVFANDKSGITFISRPSNVTHHPGRLLTHCKARKYKSNADHWLGFSSVSGSPRIVDEVVFSKEPWKESKELDQLVKTLVTSGSPIGRGGKKLGVNDPCHCGSGKKYKKCHGKPF